MTPLAACVAPSPSDEATQPTPSGFGKRCRTPALSTPRHGASCSARYRKSRISVAGAARRSDDRRRPRSRTRSDPRSRLPYRAETRSEPCRRQEKERQDNRVMDRLAAATSQVKTGGRMLRNPRPDQIGIDGWMLSESLAGSPRNTQRPGHGPPPDPPRQRHGPGQRAC